MKPNEAEPRYGRNRSPKQLNEYAQALGAPWGLYGDAPKAVLAAIAVSALTAGGDFLAEAESRVLREWWALKLALHVTAGPDAADLIAQADSAIAKATAD